MVAIVAGSKAPETNEAGQQKNVRDLSEKKMGKRQKSRSVD
jgi:hypothetical protein